MCDRICIGRLWIITVLAAGMMLTGVQPVSADEPDSREDGSPWGFASGAEWSRDHPTFNPLMHQAGARWIRYFPEWQSIQPKQGEWNWRGADAFVANCRENNLHVAGVFAYFAPWASADGGMRRGPVKDMQFWRDFVQGVASRYQQDISHWEVWNEFNGSFYQGQDKVKEYADLVREAYVTAKQEDASIKIGMNVANFDVAFVDAAIKAGAADHFDFIAVHPYENLGAVADGGEVGYLSLVGNLRQMLMANNQREDIPLWITETGYQVSVKPDAKSDAMQADMLTKAYILSLVQGFDRICWFEARGPSYGHNTDHGVIRPDWSLRPAYHALQTMISLLGQQPKYLGWLNMGEGGYGFMFQGQSGPVLAAWAPPGKDPKVQFTAEVRIIDQASAATSLASGQDLSLTRSPVYVTNLPESLVQEAQSNVGKPYPWGGDYANATQVTCRLGASNIDDGLKQRNPQTTAAVIDGDTSCRRTDFSKGGEGHYAYFRVDPQFVPYGTNELQITIVARRVATDQAAGMNLCYESAKGYRNVSEGWWTIPDTDQWHEHTWTVTDANFVGQWGWNFRFDAISSRHEFLIKEVRVSKGE